MERMITQLMNERKATRQFDPNFHLAEEEVHELIEMATTSPSSSNLQPWRFIVVRDEDVRKQLRPLALNQAQIEEASAIVVIVADTRMHERVEQINRMNETSGYMTKEQADRKIERDYETYEGKSDIERFKIAMFDAGLITMSLTLAATAKGIDSGIMGGFDPEGVASLFKLEEHLVPAILVALGKRREEPQQTTRLPLQDILL